mgnify:FL=1
MNAGFIHEFADIFRLKEHFGEISQMEGFGEKSVANMEQSIEKSRQVHPVNFIFALCIPLIGVDAGKKIVAAIGFEGFLQRLHQGDGFEDIEGIGAERSRSIVTWYQNEKTTVGLRICFMNFDRTCRSAGYFFRKLCGTELCDHRRCASL